MYGFGQLVDKNLFVGLELIQVCIGSNEIILNFFPENNRITIFNVENFLEKNRFMFEPMVNSQGNIEQIGKSVKSFTVKSSKIAKLTMSDQTEIYLDDDSPEYESVTLQFFGRIFIV